MCHVLSKCHDSGSSLCLQVCLCLPRRSIFLLFGKFLQKFKKHAGSRIHLGRHEYDCDKILDDYAESEYHTSRACHHSEHPRENVWLR